MPIINNGSSTRSPNLPSHEIDAFVLLLRGWWCWWLLILQLVPPFLLWLILAFEMPYTLRNTSSRTIFVSSGVPQRISQKGATSIGVRVPAYHLWLVGSCCCCWAFFNNSVRDRARKDWLVNRGTVEIGIYWYTFYIFHNFENDPGCFLLTLCATGTLALRVNEVLQATRYYL